MRRNTKTLFMIKTKLLTKIGRIWSFYFHRRYRGFTDASKPPIFIFLGYQHITGQTIALANVANQLSTKFDCVFYAPNINELFERLDPSIKVTNQLRYCEGQTVIADVSIVSEIRKIAPTAKIILSCHSFPDKAHSFDTSFFTAALEDTDIVHFVSEHQQTCFENSYPNIKSVGSSFVIGNFLNIVSKTKGPNEHALGIVGHLNREPKNGVVAINLMVETKASRLECWGADEIFGCTEEMTSDPRLKINGWSNDFKTIYESFDVLIFPSRFETFGLVVFEAISAGKTCVLSDIPVFRELFGEYRNVYFLSGEKQNDIRIVNNALSHSERHFNKCNFDPSEFNLKRALEWEERLETIMSAND